MKALRLTILLLTLWLLTITVKPWETSNHKQGSKLWHGRYLRSVQSNGKKGKGESNDSGQSSSEPSCKLGKTECGKVEPLENGYVKYFQSAVFDCDDGFKLQGQKMLTCDTDCQYVGQKPSCVAVPQNGDHTLFRVASRSEVPVFNTWSANTFTPGFNTPLTPSYFNVVKETNDLYKSPIVECAFNTIKTIRVSFFTNGQEVIFYKFNAIGKNKMNYFSINTLLQTSFTDITPTTFFRFFSIPGFLNLRRWYVEQFIGICSRDRGWSGVMEQRFGFCRWERRGANPLFLHSSTGQISLSTRYVEADTFITTAELDDTFPDCISYCVGMPDGNYQSCIGCNVYITCENEAVHYKSCSINTAWDDLVGGCVSQSSTCFGPRATGACLPDGCLDNPCLNGGNCSSTGEGWTCSCPACFQGIYCEIVSECGPKDKRRPQNVPCAEMTAPSNGKVTFQDVAVFGCDEGYVLSGEDKLTCDNSCRWLGQLPQCLPEVVP